MPYCYCDYCSNGQAHLCPNRIPGTFSLHRISDYKEEDFSYRSYRNTSSSSSVENQHSPSGYSYKPKKIENIKTLQEYLDWKHPTREVKKIVVYEINEERKKAGITELLEGGELDLSEFKSVETVFISDSSLKTPLIKLDVSDCADLKYLSCFDNNLIKFNISGCVSLEELNCFGNNLISVDFLNDLPNPEKLKGLVIFNNNIQPTDVSIFSKFTDLKVLKIGTMNGSLRKGKRNKFYGSFESWKNLTKLESICIEATDVNEGLEYLPTSLAKSTKGGSYFNVECSPCFFTTAKCSTIQNELRPYNYDLEAWQLAHPELMLNSRPELFVDFNSKDKWINALNDKISHTERELEQIKVKTKEIQRLENKIENLEKTKIMIDKSTQTKELKVQNQSTQTEQEYNMPGSWKWK